MHEKDNRVTTTVTNSAVAIVISDIRNAEALFSIPILSFSTDAADHKDAVIVTESLKAVRGRRKIT